MIDYNTDEPTSEEIMSLIETSGSFDFWNNPEEDIYNLNDGKEV